MSAEVNMTVPVSFIGFPNRTRDTLSSEWKPEASQSCFVYVCITLRCDTIKGLISHTQRTLRATVAPRGTLADGGRISKR